MTANNVRQAWREEVRAFSLVATVLEDPTPGLFADLATPEEGLRNLTQELPLVSFSPFCALPSDIAYGRGEPLHRPTRESDRLLDRITGSQVPRPVARRPQDPHESAVQPPVFSFRRTSASSVPAGQQQPLRSDQDVPGHSPGRSTAQELSNAPEPGDRELEGSTAVETSPDPYVFVQSGATARDRDIETARGAEYRSIYPMTLLNSLAEDALEAVEQRTPDVPVRPPGMSTPRLAPSEERVVLSQEPDRKVRHDHDDDVHTPSERGSLQLDAPPQSPTESFQDVAGSWASDLPVSGAGDLPESSPKAYSNSAAVLIDSLAEHLLTAGARSAGSPPATEAGDDGGVAQSVEASAWEQPAEEAIPGRTPFSFSGGADRKPADRLPVRPDEPDPDPIAEVASDRHPDADAFAALVNDALVRQARRHGVDLS